MEVETESEGSPQLATLRILTDMILCMNNMQLFFLQGSRLNFMEIQLRVKKLVETLQNKAEVDGGIWQLRSKTAFHKGAFESEFIQPVIGDLINEMENALHIPEELKGFLCFNLESFPRSREELEPYGKE